VPDKVWHVGEDPEAIRYLAPELLWEGWAQRFATAGIDEIEIQLGQHDEIVRVSAHIVGNGSENEYVPKSLLEAFEKIRDRRQPVREPRDYVRADDPPLSPDGPRDVESPPAPDIETAGP
jgi:hypothetical protein